MIEADWPDSGCARYVAANDDVLSDWIPLGKAVQSAMERIEAVAGLSEFQISHVERDLPAGDLPAKKDRTADRATLHARRDRNRKAGK